MITDDDFEFALHGHMERTAVAGQGAPDIERILIELDVDPTEARNALGVLVDQRREGMPDDGDGSYEGGLIDGLIIGVRAARAEASR